MKKFFNIILVIISVLVTLFIFQALNKYFPNNIISKIIRGFAVVLTPVLIALLIMYLISPLTNALVKRKVNKKTAIALSMLIFFLAFGAIFTFTAFFLVDQGKLIYAQITDPEFLITLEAWFNRNGLGGIYEMAIEFINEFDFTTLFGRANSIIGGVFSTLSGLILAPIFLWHFMNSKETIKEATLDNMPSKWRKNVLPIMDESNDVIVAYFKGKLVSIVLLFFMFLLLYAVLGLPIGFAILFAILISVLDLIPFIGPTLGSILPMIYIFSLGGTNLLYINDWYISALLANIIMIGVNVVIQYVQGNLIVPALVGKEMQINAALILVFMLFFGYIFGFWGILFAIPLGGVSIVLWSHVKKHNLFGFISEDTE